MSTTTVAIIQLLSSAVLFVLFWKTVGGPFFKKMFSVIDERESKTIGIKARVAELDKESFALRLKLDKILAEARGRGIGARDELTAKARQAADMRIEEAKRAAEVAVKEADQAIDEKVNMALLEIDAEIASLSESLSTQILSPPRRTIH